MLKARPRLPKEPGGSAERASGPSGQWPRPPGIVAARNRSGPILPGASGTTAGYQGPTGSLASLVPPIGANQRLNLAGHSARLQFSGPACKLSILDHPLQPERGVNEQL